MEQINNDCGEIESLNFLFGLPTNKFCIIDSDEDSDEECNEDDEEIITICRCCRCNKLKFIEDIVCIEIQPDKIWKCCDCIAMEVQMEIEDGIVFNPPINPAAELIKKYKEFLIDKLDIVYKYHYTFGFKDLKLVLELDRFGNDEFWDEEDSDEEDEDSEDCCKLCLNVCRPDDMCNHGIGSGRCCVCQECYDEMEKEDEEDEDEIQPHCYICFNMNMKLNVTCFNCDKLYCKNHSYCILGDNDMPYCSKKCFLDS